MNDWKFIKIIVKEKDSMFLPDGLNPTMGMCPICGKENGEILLLGHNKGKKAEMHSMTLNPCDDCKEKYLKIGVCLIEMGDNQIVNLAVIKDEAFKNIFNTAISKGKIAMVEPGLLKKIGAI